MGKKFLVLSAALLLMIGFVSVDEAKKALLLDSFQGDIAAGKTIEVQAPEKIPWDHYGAITFWFKGTGTGAQIALDILDAEGETHRFVVKDDSLERKQVVCPFDEFFPRAYGQSIMGEPNGVIDFPIKSLYFMPLGPTVGPYVVDGVSLEALN
jgi:hypothetical protein